MASIQQAIYGPLSKRDDAVSRGALSELERLYWIIECRDEFMNKHGLWPLWQADLQGILRKIKQKPLVKCKK